VKRKAILARQEIRKPKAGRLIKAWRGFRILSAFALKLTCVALVLALVSLAFLSLYGYLLTSPHIRLEQVDVLGAEEGLKNELLEMAQLNYEHSLLAVDVNALKERLEQHPWVRRANVEKSFPHTLIIRAEKQEPMALALKGRLYYMNRWGDLFWEVLPDERVDFPVVTGLSEETGEREKQIGSVLQVLHIFESQAPPWDLDHLSEVHVKEDGTLHLYVSFVPGQISLKAGELAARLEDLKRLVEHLASTGKIHLVKTIHLDYGEGAAVAFEKS
jgi:cell division protein FtsQ